MVACTSVVASTAVMLLAFARGSFGHKTKFTLADDVDGVKGTATWDILPLDAPTGHLIKDARASNVSTHGLFSYRFNVGDDIDITSLPQICREKGEGPAYQVYYDGASCYRLGGDLDDHDNQVFSLVNNENPAAGIRITYKNGEPCENNLKREFAITMYCANDVFNIPNTEAEYITEDLHCSYNFEFTSAHACPTECARNAAGDKVCSDHGECGWNEDAMRPQCFCDKGYFGPSCSETCSTGCKHGHCEWDADAQAAMCFCNHGYAGNDCSKGPYACYAQTYDGLCFLNATSAGPWVLFVIALVAFIGLFVHHRRSLGQSLNPCADVLFASGPSSYSSGGGNSGSSGYAQLGALGGDGGGYSPPSTDTI